MCARQSTEFEVCLRLDLGVVRRLITCAQPLLLSPQRHRSCRVRGASSCSLLITHLSDEDCSDVLLHWLLECVLVVPDSFLATIAVTPPRSLQKHLGNARKHVKAALTSQARFWTMLAVSMLMCEVRQLSHYRAQWNLSKSLRLPLHSRRRTAPTSPS